MKAAVSLLEKAPSRFLFDHLELVTQALDRAEGFGDDCLGRVAGRFYTIATGGERSGPSGQPFPEDVALRDRCQEALRSLPPGGAAHRLFRDVLSRAEREIQSATEEDED
jgi:hypothetical protein